MNSTLPEYKQMMSPEVRDRLARLVRRPVIMETRNLFKEFPTSSGKNQIVLKDISFQVHQREFLSIIGPSGCGKSTLIRILALKANPGEINELIEVPLPRPRRSRMLLEPEFLATREHIDKLIRPPVKREDECEFKVVNMVGDKTFL